MVEAQQSVTYVLFGLGYLLALGVLAAAALWVVDRLRHRRPSPEEQARARAVRLAALLNPDWEGLERTLRIRLPASLRTLYGNRELVITDGLVLERPPGAGPQREWEVAGFEPLGPDPSGMDWAEAPRNSLHFAGNGNGDSYYVVLGTRPDGDGPVFLYYHDGNDTERVADSLAEFLSWPRRPRRPARRDRQGH